MEELFIEIYTKKKIKYCAGCLHTDDDAKLCSMQNYTWVFTSLFTSLYLSDELQSSWICSWCIQRLNNAKNLLSNFQQAQVLLSKIAEEKSFCRTVEEINNDIFDEINKLKLKTRLNYCCDLDNCNLNKIIYIENNIKVKSEILDDYVSFQDNNIDDEIGSANYINPDKCSNEKVINDGIDCNLTISLLKSVNTKVSCKYDKNRKCKRKKKDKEIKSTSKNNLVDSAIECDSQNANGKDNKTGDFKYEIEIPIPVSVSSDSINETSQICSTSDTEENIAKTESMHKINRKIKPGTSKNLKSKPKLKKKGKDKITRPYLPHLPRRQCPECNHLFIKENALLNHLRDKHKKKYPCEQCDRVYPKEEYLKTHIAKVHEPKSGTFECDVCARVFKHRLNIVKHMIRHEKYGNSLREIERIVCDHCGKICSRQNIKSHLVKHSNVKEHHCSLCGASFKIAATLENHVKRKHKDPSLEKIFACKQCGRKFYDSTQVKYHMISIHSFQGHACPVCSKCFPTKGKAREHVRRVHEKVRPVRNKQCDFCEKVFSTKRMLQHHRYTHTGEKPYKCDLCSSAYNQGHCLKKHRIRAHGTEKPKTNVAKHINDVPVANTQQNQQTIVNESDWYGSNVD